MFGMHWKRTASGHSIQWIGSLSTAALLAACGGGGEGSPSAGLESPLAGAKVGWNGQDRCTPKTLEKAFKHDTLTTLLLVKEFKQGEDLILSGTPTAQTPKAQNDICLVKVLVGPGNPGPVGAPSTSAGIGIEVWMPAKDNWNNRMHNLGGGGWAGGQQTSTTAIASSAAASVAGVEGAVSSTTDTGHTTGSGAFAMNPDGTINETLWNDFSQRGLHEQAVKTKALANAYYGSEPRYSYWEGGSTGGRQGLKLVQLHPEHYDGLVANYPANNWTKFITAELYPQIVYQRDLAGAPLTSAQLTQMGNAAIAACGNVGGQNLGYILDTSACRYDPRNDANALCAGVSGVGGVTGISTSPACVNLTQATAMNKIWYGQTSDGSVPDPGIDNGWSLQPTGVHRWYGLPRGTNMQGLAGTNPFTIATDMVALELQNPTLATPSFINATGNGANGWMSLSYGQLSSAWDIGVALQPQFANINTDNPDLSAFASRGGKMITEHGLNDTLIPPQGTVNYYNRVATQMGGLATVQDFWKLYLVPAQGHGPANGTTNPAANPPAIANGQLYGLLTAWVEGGVAPDQVTLTTPASSPVQKSRPICVYPKKATWVSGDPNTASSYVCS